MRIQNAFQGLENLAQLHQSAFVNLKFDILDHKNRKLKFLLYNLWKSNYTIYSQSGDVEVQDEFKLLEGDKALVLVVVVG